MRAVFGHPFSLLWFSPFSTPDHGKAETYQYVVWEVTQGTRRPGQNQSGKPSPAPHWAQLWQSVAPSAEHDLLCISHTSHGQLFICFLCCQLSALYVYFCVAFSKSSCREKETLSVCDPVCKHCDESVFFWAISSIFLVCIRKLFSCSVFTLSFLKGLRADKLQKNPSYSHLFFHLYVVVSGHAGSSVFWCPGFRYLPWNLCFQPIQ